MQRVQSMLTRRAVQWQAPKSVRCFAAESDEVAADMTVLNFSLPYASVIDNVPVKRVTVPGRGGTFGISAKTPEILSELKPGVVLVDNGKDEPQRFIIPGGFAFAHAGNKVDVSAPDAVAAEDIDADLLRTKAEEAKQAADAAASGSKEEAEANIALEVYKAIGFELDIKI